jgi:Ser/Thr protein kinase RdoA (MazF antagonist)
MNDQTARAVCAQFGLGELRGKPVAVPGGRSHLLWRVETAGGTFAVKLINRDWGAPDYVAWYDRSFTLEQAACSAGVAMPRPVPVLATGRSLGEVTGDERAPITVRVHGWVEGTQLDQVLYPRDVVSRVGGMLGRIHALGMGSDASPREALRVFGDEHWRALAERVDGAGAAWAPDLRAVVAAIAELEAYVRGAHEDATPLLLSHRDSDQKNYMRTPAGELVLVDWDAAGPVNARHDLANHALVWAGCTSAIPTGRWLERTSRRTAARAASMRRSP